MKVFVKTLMGTHFEIQVKPEDTVQKADVVNLFKVGQLAEMKSFEKGYLGAWFRCKIREVMRHPFNESKRAYVVPQRVEDLMKCYWPGSADKPREELPTLEQIRDHCMKQLEQMRTDHMRRLNPTPYKFWWSSSAGTQGFRLFSKLEKDIRVNYLFSRIIKLIVVELYCTHTTACIFYYLATTLSAAKEEYTWIGSQKLGDYSYSSFRDIDLWKRYITSLYFAIVTMATVGYGDIHVVNLREMIFVMVYVSFDMILGAYLDGNMTTLIVKGSKTEQYMDRMTDLLKYMDKNRLNRDIRNQIKGHVRLQYDSSYTDSAVIQDLPVSIRAQISETLYKTYIENVSLFRGCSSEFINHVVTRVHKEFFLPGEVIMEQGVVADQLYFICLGKLVYSLENGRVRSVWESIGVPVNILDADESTTANF